MIDQHGFGRTLFFSGAAVNLQAIGQAANLQYQLIKLYRKFKADQIFTGYNFASGSKVLITNAAGDIVELVDEKDAGDEVEMLNGILCPGFINAHCHLELSHMKGLIEEGTGLVDFVYQVITRREMRAASLSVEAGAALLQAKDEAMQKAEAELYRGGVVAVGDICNTPDSIGVKATSQIRWRNFIEVSGFLDASAEKRFDLMQQVQHEFHKHLPQTISTLTPHAPYSVSKTLFKKLNVVTAGQLISIHNQEAKSENELFYHKSGAFLRLYQKLGIDIAGFTSTGRSSLQSWAPYFNEGQSIMSVHNTFTDTEDIRFLETRVSPGGLFFCLCPNANRYIESAVPPILLLRGSKHKIVIGTDSYASNHQLNILAEIKTIQAVTANQVPLEEILQWATINGAKALEMDDTLGSFEKGKRPGILLLKKLNPVTNDASAAYVERLL